MLFFVLIVLTKIIQVQDPALTFLIVFYLTTIILIISFVKYPFKEEVWDLARPIYIVLFTNFSIGYAMAYSAEKRTQEEMMWFTVAMITFTAVYRTVPAFLSKKLYKIKGPKFF